MNSTGTKIIDSNTIYRIGSISKVYTVLAVLRLRDKINWDDPVTKYVPELNQIADNHGGPVNHLTTVQWKHITIGALAGQLSGLGRDCKYQPFPQCKKSATPFQSLTFICA